MALISSESTGLTAPESVRDNIADGFVTLTGFTPNLGKLSMAALRNVNGLASWRQAENSLESLNVTMLISGRPPLWKSDPRKGVVENW